METNVAAPILGSLAQPTRLDIFRALVAAGHDGLSAGMMSNMLGVAAPVLSFHLKELRFAALVDSESQGRFVIYRARYDTMNALLEFLTENCCVGSKSADAADCCPPVFRKSLKKGTIK
jgi:ArsR family transcriptional regulator, arsenate/arsenite/antimonite-responsive transcriptional repressor